MQLMRKLSPWSVKYQNRFAALCSGRQISFEGTVHPSIKENSEAYITPAKAKGTKKLV